MSAKCEVKHLFGHEGLIVDGWNYGWVATDSINQGSTGHQSLTVEISENCGDGEQVRYPLNP